MKQLSCQAEKRRGATAAVLTLALGAAVYLNWSFSREAPPSLVVSDTPGSRGDLGPGRRADHRPLVLETAAGADTQMMSAEETANKNYGEAQLVSVNKDSGTEFFESARLTRSKARDEALDTLKKVPEDTKLTSEEKEQLTTQLSDRISNITLEAKLETLIKSKGFTDCVVNLEGSKANVTVHDRERCPDCRGGHPHPRRTFEPVQGADCTGHYDCRGKITEHSVANRAVLWYTDLY